MFLRARHGLKRRPGIVQVFLAQIAASGGAAVACRPMPEEKEPDVDAHLRALDDEIARLRKLEAALDRKLAEAEAERRADVPPPGEPEKGA